MICKKSYEYDDIDGNRGEEIISITFEQKDKEIFKKKILEELECECLNDYYLDDEILIKMECSNLNKELTFNIAIKEAFTVKEWENVVNEFCKNNSDCCKE